MFRNLCFLMACIILLASCSNNDKTASELLDAPPFNMLTDSIRQSPNNSDLYYRRGSLLYSSNEKDYAMADLRKAWQLEHREDFALSLTTLLKQKNVDSAIVFLHQAIKSLPNSIALRIGLARGYQQKNQLDSAMWVCQQILKQYPNQLDALVLTSDLLKATNKDRDALAVLEQAYAIAPLDKELAYNLDYEYAELKDPKALSLSDHMIQLDSTETVARAYYVKATYFKNVGKSSNAIVNYDAAVTHDYNFLDAYLDKGQLLYDEKKFKEAEETLQVALKISPTTADFYLWLAKTQEAQGKKAEAKLNYQRAYGLDKTLIQAKDAADKL